MSISIRHLATAAAALLAVSSGALPTSAHAFKVGAIVVEHPWSRQTPPGAKVGGAYLAITNTGTEPDRLVGGSAAVVGGFEIHASTTENGVARMRRLDDGIAIAPGETITLAPMGTHVMLTRLAEPIVAGKPFAGTLVFEKARKVDVSFSVEPLGGKPKASGHAGHGG